MEAKAEKKELTAVEIIDSVLFAQNVETEINSILKSRRKIASKGKLKADAVGAMIKADRFNPKFIINEYVKVLIKESQLSSREREVVNIIGTNAYIQTEKILNNENK